MPGDGVGALLTAFAVDAAFGLPTHAILLLLELLFLGLYELRFATFSSICDSTSVFRSIVLFVGEARLEGRSFVLWCIVLFCFISLPASDVTKEVHRKPARLEVGFSLKSESKNRMS